MIGLLCTVVIRDIVLIKIRCHAVEKGHCEGVGVVVEEFDHAACCHTGFRNIAHGPRQIHITVYVMIELCLGRCMMRCGLFMTRLSGVVHVEQKTALIRADFRHRVTRGHIEIMSLATNSVTDLELPLDHDEFVL